MSNDDPVAGVDRTPEPPVHDVEIEKRWLSASCQWAWWWVCSCGREDGGYGGSGLAADAGTIHQLRSENGDLHDSVAALRARLDAAQEVLDEMDEIVKASPAAGRGPTGYWRHVLRQALAAAALSPVPTDPPRCPECGVENPSEEHAEMFCPVPTPCPRCKGKGYRIVRDGLDPDDLGERLPCPAGCPIPTDPEEAAERLCVKCGSGEFDVIGLCSSGACEFPAPVPSEEDGEGQ